MDTNPAILPGEKPAASAYAADDISDADRDKLTDWLNALAGCLTHFPSGIVASDDDGEVHSDESAFGEYVFEAGAVYQPPAEEADSRTVLGTSFSADMLDPVKGRAQAASFQMYLYTARNVLHVWIASNVVLHGVKVPGLQDILRRSVLGLRVSFQKN